MQAKIMTAKTNTHRTSQYVDALVERSSGYYTEWLKSPRQQEPVDLPQTKLGNDIKGELKRK